MTIIDAHTHVTGQNGDFEPLYALAKRLNYDKLTVHSLQCAGRLLQNHTCALCKLSHPGMTYAFGGLDYLTGRDYMAQAKNLRAMGFDGIKMLEGKPTTRRMLGMALDDPRYDAFYDYMEETQFPLVMHVADPGEFWDRSKAPSWAVERGWLYDETDVPYEQYYDEVERMLAKHPRLRAIFAHFFFLSGDPDRVQRFLDDHPSVSIDITAGIEMYENFSKDPAFWREFFVKNSRRIIFGTDSTDEPDVSDDSGEKVDISGYAGMELDFLRKDAELRVYDKKLRGLGLPESALELILSKNFIQYAGEAPRDMDIEKLRREADFLRGFMANAEDIKALDEIVSKI